MPTIPQSFFDDETTVFTFNKLEPVHMNSLAKPCKLESTILCENNELHFRLRGVFKLHDNLIIYYMEGISNSPAYALDILHAKLSKVEKHGSGKRYKLRLSKNLTSFDFYFLRKEEAENWRNELKSQCVLDGFHEEFDPICVLGRGAFASVHLVQHNPTFILFAAKGFCKKNMTTSKTKAALISEINMLRKINHKNLINLYEVYESQNSVYLVMEYTTGQTLKHVIKKKNLFDSQIMEITKSILSALTSLESQKIMHRDLKPDNILVEDDLTIKIIDFGLAAHYDTQDFLHDRCGTAGYVAPEVFAFNRNNLNSFYDNKCDVFSAGCILFQMLLGFRMFEGDDKSQIFKLNRMYGDTQSSKSFKRYISTEIQNPESTVNNQGLDLLEKMLEPDCQKRISASEALNHPYFENRALSFNDIISDFAIDEKPKHHSSVATSLPESAKKCLFSINCSVASTYRKLKSTRKSSQDESVLSPTTCGTSVGHEFSFEKITIKQTGKSERMSIFGPLKKKDYDFCSVEHSEEVQEDENDEQCMVDEVLKTVPVNQPKEMKLSLKK